MPFIVILCKRVFAITEQLYSICAAPAIALISTDTDLLWERRPWFSTSTEQGLSRYGILSPSLSSALWDWNIFLYEDCESLLICSILYVIAWRVQKPTQDCFCCSHIIAKLTFLRTVGVLLLEKLLAVHFSVFLTERFGKQYFYVTFVVLLNHFVPWQILFSFIIKKGVSMKVLNGCKNENVLIFSPSSLF